VLGARWPYPVCINRHLGQEEILHQEEEEEEDGELSPHVEEAGGEGEQPTVSMSSFTGA